MTECPNGGSNPRRPLRRPIQVGLGSILVFITLSALLMKVTTGAGMGIALAVFAMVLLGTLLLVYQWIFASPPEFTVVREAGTNAEAHMCRDFLRERGVEAQVLEDVGAFTGLTINAPRVLVPTEKAEQAERLLDELDAELDARDEDKPPEQGVEPEDDA